MCHVLISGYLRSIISDLQITSQPILWSIGWAVKPQGQFQGPRVSLIYVRSTEYDSTYVPGKVVGT